MDDNEKNIATIAAAGLAGVLANLITGFFNRDRQNASAKLDLVEAAKRNVEIAQALNNQLYDKIRELEHRNKELSSELLVTKDALQEVTRKLSQHLKTQ